MSRRPSFAPVAAEPWAGYKEVGGVEVATQSGGVLGSAIDLGDRQIARFLGIPYARTPAGIGRFQPPAQISWNDTRNCRVPAGTVAQLPTDAGGRSELAALVGPGWVSGDNLVLNVWTPDVRGAVLPVMVFIHGGAFTGGAGLSECYDGSTFARDGVVCVTINYRCNIAGFLRLPDAPDNRGLMDQLAALSWIRENIASFGGDPDNMTIFGESAGALSVCALVAAADDGLFRRAIAQSGGGSNSFTTTQAEMVTHAVGETLGIEPSAESLAEIDDARLLEAVQAVLSSPIGLSDCGEPDRSMGLTRFNTVVEGELLRAQPVEMIKAGAGKNVDLMIGNNLDEMNLYLLLLSRPVVTEDMLPAALKAVHPDPEALIIAYRAAGRGVEPIELLSAIQTDLIFAMPVKQMADAHSATGIAGTYRYEFTYRSHACGGRLGACHGIEIPFVFDTLDHAPSVFCRADAEARELATRVHAAWVNFATYGSPGWDPYTSQRPLVQRLGSTRETTIYADGPERALW